MFSISNFKNQISKFFGRGDYRPLIEVRIFKNAILHNLRAYQTKYPKVSFVPVLKSNAYGHGLKEVGKILDDYNLSSSPSPQKEGGEHSIPFFVVDSFYEALVLRREGIKTKILILGYATLEQINHRLSDVSFTIIDLEQLKNISKHLKSKTNFHLKIDTGMHRQGILSEQVTEAIAIFKNTPKIFLEGVCSHFADADNLNPDFTKKQIGIWNEIVKNFRLEFPSIKYFHTSNTAGAHFLPDIDSNVSRLGIGLYGINESAFEKLNLKPALEMVSLISSIKKIPIGEKVGYGGTYETKQPTIVATVPVGYNEGVDRRLSNLGFFKIANIDCPLVGRVSMNMSSIDVSDFFNVIPAFERESRTAGLQLEDRVLVVSKNPSDKNSIENMAKLCGCLPYEILVHIPQSLSRKVV